MKGTRAHFFDYWAPQKKKKYSRARRDREGLYFRVSPRARHPNGRSNGERWWWWGWWGWRWCREGRFYDNKNSVCACESDPQTLCGHLLQLRGEHRPRLLSHRGVNETHCCWWEIQSSPMRSLKTLCRIRKSQNPVLDIMGVLRYFFCFFSLYIYIIKEDVTFTLLFCLINKRLNSIKT